MILVTAVYTLTLYFIIKYFEDNLYDLYIDTNIIFELSYIPFEVCCILTVIHILILFFLGYNKVKTI